MTEPARRRIVSLLVPAVGLGLATTVAVAWALASVCDPWNGRRTLERSLRPPDAAGNPEIVTIERYRRAGVLCYETSYMRGVPSAVDEFNPGTPVVVEPWAGSMVRPWTAAGQEWPSFVPFHTPYAVVAIDVTAYGWPLPALYRTTNGTPIATPRRYQWTQRGSIPLPGTTAPGPAGLTIKGPILLPFLPVWQGLLLDWALAAMIWLGAILGWRALHRGLRRRRGLCVACGYDLSATATGAPCPECGLVHT
jgi:hypothetical protein